MLILKEEEREDGKVQTTRESSPEERAQGGSITAVFEVPTELLGILHRD